MGKDQERQPDFFNQFEKRKEGSIGIFARIPPKLHKQVMDICSLEGKSKYKVIEAGLTLLVNVYAEHSEEIERRIADRRRKIVMNILESEEK